MRSFIIKTLNEIENSQVIDLRRDIEVKERMEWAFFHVRDPNIKSKISHFLFRNNSLHKKILIGRYDYINEIIPISYLTIF